MRVCPVCHKSFDEPHEFKRCNACRARQKENMARYYIKHREKLRAKGTEYYWKNHEKELERHRIYRHNNPEKIQAYSLKHNKKYYKENSERIIEQHRGYNKRNFERRARKQHKYYLANRERILSSCREDYLKKREEKLEYLAGWRKRNPIRIRINNLNREHRIRGNGGKLPSNIGAILFEQQNGLCYLCSKQLYARFDDPPEIEHKVPVSRGGANEVSNVALAHKSCNSKKRARTHEEYLIFLANNKNTKH